MEEQLTAADRELLLQLFGQVQAVLARSGLGTLSTGTTVAAAEAEPPPVRLSKRMQEFLKLLCHPEGYHYKQIAAIMKCSTHTLRTYQRRIAERYGVNGKSALISWAFANGFAGVKSNVAKAGKTRRTR